MAKQGFTIDFKGFNELAQQLGEIGDETLKKAVDNAFTASKDYVNSEVANAMNKSPYHFDRGQGYSLGRAKASLENVKQMPVEWAGNTASAYIGVRMRDALEVVFLIYGTPHLQADTNLLNAIKVKGKIAKEVSRIQQEEFNKVLMEALNND